MIWPMIGVAVAFLVIVAVGAWVLFLPNAAGPTGEPGQLTAAQPIVDLGQVPFDRQVQAQFMLENTGGQPVHVVGVPAVKTLEGC
jgi:hypothetical protein